jgi:hypothetical protein
MSAAELRLAWDLADAVAPLINKQKKSAMYAELGAGDTRAVIEKLLRTVTAGGHVLSLPLLARVHAWLGGYAGSEWEPAVRELWEQAIFLTTRPEGGFFGPRVGAPAPSREQVSADPRSRSSATPMASAQRRARVGGGDVIPRGA